MHISFLEIKNFRGIDITIENMNDIVTVIGQNDSGKSNVCAAILKVLDYNKRRIPFQEVDSTMGNKEDIIINLKLVVDNLTNEQLAMLHEVIHESENGKYVYVRLVSKYNSEVLIYEDELLIGDLEKDYKEYNITKQNPIDKVLSVIYINPTYDTKSETRHFFEYKEAKHIEDNTKLSKQFEDSIKMLTDTVKNEEALAEILSDINDLGRFERMFDGMSFELTPNIHVDNIYKSLEISTLDSKGNLINNIGDGKNKIFSMLLKEKTYNDDKKKIIIVEEPENHLYVLLQKYYIDSILSFNPSQMIVTTHSPHVVDFEKTNQILKIQRLYDEGTEKFVRKIYTYNIDNEEFKKYGYLINVEISEMMYYDTVILIEGESEKYFYSLLLSKDEKFKDYIFNNKIGIFSVNGIAFEKTKELLESLGITVYIKTDNDVFKNSVGNYFYAGITRSIKYLSDESKETLMNILNFDSLESKKFECTESSKNIKVIEECMEQICSLFKENNILFSKHNEGFEKDFLDYIRYSQEDYEEVIKKLKNAKLINLHEFILSNNIDITIDKNDSDSILLGFMKND